jgi:hypothetical protein
VRNKKWFIAIAMLAAFLVLSAESCQGRADTQKKQQAVAAHESDVSANILSAYSKSQPPPQRPWSQLRQNLIELETAQMDTTQTTTFFFNQGVREPLSVCPSIGFPIAATSQLTNPDQKITESRSDGDNGNVVVPQIDPNGVFAGDSTGTYVMCIDAQGRPYANYWEGFVQTVTGPAKWNADAGRIELVGPPSFEFTKGK